MLHLHVRGNLQCEHSIREGGYSHLHCSENSVFYTRTSFLICILWKSAPQEGQCSNREKGGWFFFSYFFPLSDWNKKPRSHSANKLVNWLPIVVNLDSYYFPCCIVFETYSFGRWIDRSKCRGLFHTGDRLSRRFQSPRLWWKMGQDYAHGIDLYYGVTASQRGVLKRDRQQRELKWTKCGRELLN